MTKASVANVPSIPAPIHRRPPPVAVSESTTGGSGTGTVSFRSVREASFDEVRKTCQYYEAKGAGNYVFESRVGRLLFDFSRDVQQEVKFLEIKDKEKDKKIKALEKTLEEWEDSFGTSAKAPKKSTQALLQEKLAATTSTGPTPRQVQEQLIHYQMKVDELEAELVSVTEKLNQRNEENMKSFKQAIQEQKDIARDRVIDEASRLQESHQREIAQLKENHEKDISVLKGKYASSCKGMMEFKDKETQRQLNLHDGHVKQLEEDMAKMSEENARVLRKTEEKFHEMLKAKTVELEKEQELRDAERKRASEAELQKSRKLIRQLQQQLEARESAVTASQLTSALTQLSKGMDPAQAAASGIPPASMNKGWWDRDHEQLQRELSKAAFTNDQLLKELEAKNELIERQDDIYRHSDYFKQENEALRVTMAFVLEVLDRIETTHNCRDIDAVRQEIKKVYVPTHPIHEVKTTQRGYRSGAQPDDPMFHSTKLHQAKEDMAIVLPEGAAPQRGGSSSRSRPRQVGAGPSRTTAPVDPLLDSGASTSIDISGSHPNSMLSTMGLPLRKTFK